MPRSHAPDKVDGNQRLIVQALVGVGAKVWIINKELDALVLFRGKVYIFDFKSDPKAPRTVTQQRMVDEGWPVIFPTTRDEALRAIGAIW